jgi:hypothetical protein
VIFLEDKYMIINVDPDNVDFIDAKAFIKEQAGEDSEFFSFHTALTGEFYVRLSAGILHRDGQYKPKYEKMMERIKKYVEKKFRQ